MSCGKECHVGHVGLFWSAVPNCDPKAISLFPQIWGPKQLIMNHTHVDTWPWIVAWVWPWIVAWVSQGIRTTISTLSMVWMWSWTGGPPKVCSMWHSAIQQWRGHSIQPLRLQKLRAGHGGLVADVSFGPEIYTDWWFGTCFIFPYMVRNIFYFSIYIYILIGNNHPKWRTPSFSEG